jgi:hypothetical protein
MYSCQRTRRGFRRTTRSGLPPREIIINRQVVGVTGFEPVTLRLSSACSNQLSYTPEKFGGAEETRTPDILLAKQTLYQLSYSPTGVSVSSLD